MQLKPSDRLGVFTRAEALQDGWTDRGLSIGVRRGQLVRVRHGAYVEGSAWPPEATEQHRVRARAALIQAGSHFALSHVSAAVELGVPVWDLPLDEVHLTRLQPHSGRRQAGVAQHRGGLASHEIEIVNGVPVTSGTRTAWDVLRISDFEHAVVVTDGLLRLGLTTHTQLRAAIEPNTLTPFTLAMPLVIGFANGLSESVGESRLRVLLHRAGLPTPTLQHEVRTSHGHVIARLDFLIEEHRCFVEFDGRQKYAELLAPGERAEDVVLREKRRDQQIFEETGWRGLRLTWADLEHPQRTITRLRRFIFGPRWGALERHYPAAG